MTVEFENISDKEWNQIVEYRRTWANYLLTPTLKKAEGVLDAGNECRCCIGHGAFILGMKRENFTSDDEEDISKFSYDGETKMAPESMVQMLEMWEDCGSTSYGYMEPLLKFVSEGSAFIAASLAMINDSTDATPQDIGEYLLTVLEGGDMTPFKSREDINSEREEREQEEDIDGWGKSYEGL